MYSSMHNFNHTAAGQAAQSVALQAEAQSLGEGAQYAVRTSLLDQLRGEAATALFSLGAWVKPRTQARAATPVQLRQVAGGAAR